MTCDIKNKKSLMYYYVGKPDYSGMTEEEKKEQEPVNAYNSKVLDAILDDDSDKFIEILSEKKANETDINYQFKMTNYKFPEIALYNPPIASLCALFNSEKCFYALIQQFSEGLNSEQLQKKDRMSRSLMHFAAFGGNLRIIKDLEKAGYDLNEKDGTRKTPSHYSAISGTTEVMKYIISKGIKIFYNVEYGSMTPLHMACLYGNLEVVKFICETANPIDLIEADSYHSNYYRNLTPLHLACEAGNDDIVNYFLTKDVMWKKQINALNREGRSPLLIAVQFGNLECVKALMKTGKAKLYLKGRKHVALVDAAKNGFQDIVVYLLQNGDDINITNYKKKTALDVAVENEDWSMIKLLINNGAMNDFDEQKMADLFVKVIETMDMDLIEYFDKKFKIPYQSKGDALIGKAVQLESEEIVNYLLDKNCNLNNIGQYVSFTSKWRPFMDFLKNKGVNVSGIESEGGVPLIVKSIKGGSIKSVKKMISEGSKLTREIIDKYDCILSTCIKGNRQLFNFLLTFQPNMTKATSYLYNLLCDYREYQDSSKATKMKDRLKMAATLLSKYGADPNQTEIICEAAIRKNLPILELFAKHHVNFNTCNININDLDTIDHAPIIQFLKNHGYITK